MDEVIGMYAASAGALLYGLARAKSRIELSLAKHRSLAGHPRIAKQLMEGCVDEGFDVSWSETFSAGKLRGRQADAAAAADDHHALTVESHALLLHRPPVGRG